MTNVYTFVYNASKSLKINIAIDCMLYMMFSIQYAMLTNKQTHDENLKGLVLDW